MTAGILSSIHTPADVHALSAQQLRDLCLEIRATLLDYGKKHGGHIGSNLGVVELTVALHRVFDSPATVSFSTCRTKATCTKCLPAAPKHTWTNLVLMR